jgi:hypothetical protein
MPNESDGVLKRELFFPANMLLDGVMAHPIMIRNSKGNGYVIININNH